MAVRRAVVAWAATLIVSCGLLALPLVAFAATSSVTIQNSAFAPATTPVRVGDTVTWTNRDAFSHTSTSDTGAWDTGVIAAGASRSITFSVPGTFAYHCSIHAFMKGTVIVQAVSTPPPPTPPPPPPPTATPTPVRTAPPTPVRTAPPTLAPTAPSTVAPTEAPTAAPTTAAPSASVAPTAAAAEAPTPSASPTAVAVQLTPAPVPGAGPGPLLFGVAALAVVALGAIAFFLVRRS
jgi:plastocyanin